MTRSALRRRGFDIAQRFTEKVLLLNPKHRTKESIIIAAKVILRFFLFWRSIFHDLVESCFSTERVVAC